MNPAKIKAKTMEELLAKLAKCKWTGIPMVDWVYDREKKYIKVVKIDIIPCGLKEPKIFPASYWGPFNKEAWI